MIGLLTNETKRFGYWSLQKPQPTYICQQMKFLGQMCQKQLIGLRCWTTSVEDVLVISDFFWFKEWDCLSNCLQSKRVTNEWQWCKSWFHEPKGWISPLQQPFDDRWLVNHKACSFSNPLCPQQSHCRLTCSQRRWGLRTEDWGLRTED